MANMGRQALYTEDTMGNFIDCLTVDLMPSTVEYKLLMGSEAFGVAAKRGNMNAWFTPAGDYTVVLDDALGPYDVEVV